jgi:hypothetical protein
MFCKLMLCGRTCVGVGSCITLYHVDLVSSDSGVEAMIFQIFVHSVFGYSTTIRINCKSCQKKSQIFVSSVAAGPVSSVKDLREAS